MTVVTRTAQHGILTVNFLREQYAVTVKWKEGILALIEFLEIECITDTDGRSVITVAPCNPVTVFNPSDTRVIFIFRIYHLRIAGLKDNRLMIDFPVDAVLAETCKDIHLYSSVVATEHPSKSIFEGNYRTIENTIR